MQEVDCHTPPTQCRRALSFAPINPSAKATAVSRPLPLPSATTAGRLLDNSPRAAFRVDSTVTASIRVLEKCGFSREGLARRYLCINGVWQDHLLFGLLHEDFRG